MLSRDSGACSLKMSFGAGYCELLQDPEGGAEIGYFGLLPAFIGRGLQVYRQETRG